MNALAEFIKGKWQIAWKDFAAFCTNLGLDPDGDEVTRFMVSKGFDYYPHDDSLVR